MAYQDIVACLLLDPKYIARRAKQKLLSEGEMCGLSKQINKGQEMGVGGNMLLVSKNDLL